jgi:hypothetical protein
MALIARVELVGSLTHDGNGRKFKKGEPQIITTPSDIQYYQSQAGFTVVFLSQEKTKVVEGAKPPKKPVANVIVNDVDEDDDDGEENDDGEDDGEDGYEDDDGVDGDDSDDSDEDDDGEDDEGEDDGEEEIVYTKTMLEDVKKSELKKIAASLGLDVSGTVAELKKRIIKATKK